MLSLSLALVHLITHIHVNRVTTRFSDCIGSEVVKYKLRPIPNKIEIVTTASLDLHVFVLRILMLI